MYIFSVQSVADGALPTLATCQLTVTALLAATFARLELIFCTAKSGAKTTVTVIVVVATQVPLVGVKV